MKTEKYGLTFEMNESSENHFVDGRKVAEISDMEITDVEITNAYDFASHLCDIDHPSVDSLTGENYERDCEKVVLAHTFSQNDLIEIATDMMVAL